MVTAEKNKPTGVLASFTAMTTFDQLPAGVVQEIKRILLDSIGCALAGVGVAKGKVAVEFAKYLGGKPEATILATGDSVSSVAAAFANGELMNAMDFDTYGTPGHVSAFVVPAALALAEREKATGKDLIVAIALAHEVAARVGASLRGLREGPSYPPPLSGMGACVFGAAAGAAKILGFDPEKVANSFGIAGALTPLPISAKWQSLTYTPMFKYTSAGWVAQCGVTGALLTEMGCLGDTTFLDGDVGFWRMYGSDICRWDRIARGLGQEWLLMRTAYKAYPCAASIIPMVEAFAKIIEKHGFQPEEIESVTAKGEPMVSLPAYSVRELRSHMDAQFNVFYSLAMVAHRVAVYDWQDDRFIRNPGIPEFMKKVKFEPYAKFEESRRQELEVEGLPYIVKRPAAVRVIARGKVFEEEVEYLSWGPSDLERTRVADKALWDKFRSNAAKRLPSVRIERAIECIYGLEALKDVSELVGLGCV